MRELEHGSPRQSEQQDRRRRRQGQGGLGKATGDDSTENEGKLDQAKSSLKDAGENVKDAFKK